MALILSDSISIFSSGYSSSYLGYSTALAAALSSSEASFFSGFSPSSLSSSASCLSAASLASLSAYALFSASIFFCLSISFLIFSKLFSNVFLNSGVSYCQLDSNFFNVSFSSCIRLLFASRCSVKWLKYSILFCLTMFSISSKIGLYFYFSVS